MSLRIAWSTEEVPGQPGLDREALFQGEKQDRMKPFVRQTHKRCRDIFTSQSLGRHRSDSCNRQEMEDTEIKK